MVVATPSGSSACPFCETIRSTLTQQVDAADAAVFAQRDLGGAGGAGGSQKMFRIVQVLDGREKMGPERSIRALYFDDHSADQKFLVLGNSISEEKPSELMWAQPLPLSEEAFRYIRQQFALPRDSHERISLALKYLTSEEQILRRDAYDEFAIAPYDHLHQIKDELDADDLIAQIRDEKTPIERRKLYYTLLGVCGGGEHVAVVEELLTGERPPQQAELDALSACYMTLHGEPALELLERQFLTSEDIEQAARASAVVLALRFHGERDQEVSRQAIIEVMQRMVARPQLARMILADLARWQAWSAADDVIGLYDKAVGEAESIKVPAFRYLSECPLPQAQAKVQAILAENPAARDFARPYFPAQTTRTAHRSEDSAAAANSTTFSEPAAPSVDPDQAQLEAGDGSEDELEAEGESSVITVAWLAIFPVAAACLLVLLFWRQKQSGTDTDDDSDDEFPSE